jgi:hypothetical protein
MSFEPLAKTGRVLAGTFDVIATDTRKHATDADELLAEELARCDDCGRTPLIGEYVHLYGATDVVCELCRMLRPDVPISSALVSHSLGPAHRNDPAVVVRVTRR